MISDLNPCVVIVLSLAVGASERTRVYAYKNAYKNKFRKANIAYFFPILVVLISLNNL